MNQTRSVKFIFGPFELIPEQLLLTKDGVRVPLGSRAMALLLELSANQGAVVSAAELMRAAWPDTVVEDNNLRVQIASLRRALGETDAERFITTVPMKGYAFVAHVDRQNHQRTQARVTGSDVLEISSLGSLKGQAGTPLPYRTSELIGRLPVVAALKEALPTRRLVTLVGPAGIGKTSVAIVAAAEMAACFHDGVRFADLTPLSDASHVPSAVATALGIRVLADNPKDAILAGVRDKSLLLVLDNCEHVVEAVATLAEDLLAEASGVRILATSREAIRAAGEWVHPLPPLEAPASGGRLTFAEVREYPAVRLFLERILQAQSDASFCDSDVETLSWVCRELDGVPLAIELIAARFSMLGLAGLVARMSDRLVSLGQGRRSAHPRHRTLRAALDWSYDLLTEEERCLFRSLSVFRAGFSLDGACAVAGPALVADAPVLLAELLAKSLIAVDHRNGATPYRLLATTRTYAEELLAERGEQAQASQRHLDWIRRVMVSAEQSLARLSPMVWREANSPFIDDIRAAVKWAKGQEALRKPLIQLIACASPLWFHLGLLSESLNALRWSVDNRDGVEVDTDVDLRSALTYAHVSMVLEGPTPEADTHLDRARALALKPGSAILRMQSSWTTFIRGVVAGNYAASLDACDEFRQRAEAAGDREAVFVYHRMVSLSEHLLGRQTSALEHNRKALAPMAGIEMRLLHGDPQQSDHRSAALTHLARILLLKGETRQAIEAAESAYQEALEADRRQAPVYALSYGVCPVMLWAGRLDLAERYIALLKEATRRNAMPFWSLWPTMYEYALKKRQADEPADRDEVEMFGLNPGHKDMLATLGVGYLPPEVLDRATTGKCDWAKPEVLRLAAIEMLGRSGSLEDAGRLLAEADQLAGRQGAVAWRLRVSLTMAGVLLAKGEKESAVQCVGAAASQVVGDGISRDERCALRFLRGESDWEHGGPHVPSLRKS